MSDNKNFPTPADKNSEGREPPQGKTPFDFNERLFRYKIYYLQENNELIFDDLENFRKTFEKEPRLKPSEADCAKELEWIENLPSPNPLLYRSLLERMSDPKLCSLILSRLCLQSASEPRLVIDIKGYLEGAVRSLEELETFDKGKMVKAYEREYDALIRSKIEEGDIYIRKLYDDIQQADKESCTLVATLLKEVEALRKKGEASKAELIKKRDDLKEAIYQKSLFGWLGFIIRGLGLCFPPAGSIVSDVANAGLSALLTPAATPAQVSIILGHGQTVKLLAQAPDKKEEETALTRLCDFTTSAKTLLDAGTALLKEPCSDEEKLQALEKAVRIQEEQNRNLGSFKEQVSLSLKTSLAQFVDEVSTLQARLKEKSQIALGFNRLEIKRCFENMKGMMEAMTRGYSSSEGFLKIIRQMEEALDTTLHIYTLVQDYQERRELAHYMANIASPGAGDERMLEMRRNIFMEQYARAMAAVRQWAFPFESHFIDRTAGTEIKKQLKDLQRKVNDYHTGINSAIDNSLWRATFSNAFDGGPFYVWKYCKEMTQLFQGQQAIFYADIMQTSFKGEVIKFNKIEIQIKSANPEWQTELENELKKYNVELRHSGRSYYKYENQIHTISSEGEFCLGFSLAKKEDGFPLFQNRTYEKMKRGDFLLSPYTHWAIQLVGRNGSCDLYDKFKEKISACEIYLVGEGQYII